MKKIILVFLVFISLILDTIAENKSVKDTLAISVSQTDPWVREAGLRYVMPILARVYKGFGNQQMSGVMDNNNIRMLTPIEYERLQNVPDNYSSVVSNTQRYKMLGNGWTVDVIAHIFKNIEI